MHRTAAKVWSREVQSRLRELARLSPEWDGWLDLLELVLRELEEPVWEVPLERRAERRPEAPLLDGVTLVLDPRPARRWLRRLSKRAAAATHDGVNSLAGLKSRRLDGMALLAAGARQDRAALERIAGEAGVEADALAAVAGLAVLPLLQACARRLEAERPRPWTHGYCPICGAWPALAELRGLERKRQLRCGRCGGDWEWSVLHCPFCDERDHERLSALVPEGEEDLRRVETCTTCKGYVKTITTVAPTPAWELPLVDLQTVELELAALERGYTRPDWPAYALELSIVEPTRRSLAGFGGGR